MEPAEDEPQNKKVYVSYQYHRCIIPATPVRTTKYNVEPPLPEGSVISMHKMIVYNRPVDSDTVNQGGHRPTGSTRGHAPR